MEVIVAARALACLFFALLFLQSGIDKAVDWKGNIAYFNEHFAKTPLRRFVPLLGGFLTLMEILAGTLCAVGVLFIVATLFLNMEVPHSVVYFRGSFEVPALGMTLACANLCMLFFGQRMAKDYAGAASLAGYFGAALVGLIVQWPLLTDFSRMP